MNTEMKKICVFCGANPGTNPAYAEAARALGHALAARGLGLVYGGGRVGLMGVVADAALEAGAEVDGSVTRLHIVESMHERKALMAKLSDGFVVLPGGFGTLEEAFEVLTWSQLGLHKKGTVFLDVNGYWSRLNEMLDSMVTEGFVKREHRMLSLTAATPEQSLDMLAAYRPPALTRWIERVAQA
jgi:uncharacterized protein (TIGR00730 family)